MYVNPLKGINESAIISRQFFRSWLECFVILSTLFLKNHEVWIVVVLFRACEVNFPSDSSICRNCSYASHFSESSSFTFSPVIWSEINRNDGVHGRRAVSICFHVHGLRRILSYDNFVLFLPSVCVDNDTNFDMSSLISVLFTMNWILSVGSVRKNWIPTYEDKTRSAK